jgi:hypothetical protein
MHNTYLQHGAQIYNKLNGLPPLVQGFYVPVAETVGRAIADAYDSLPLYDTSNLDVCLAYTQFAVEVCDQFAFVTKTLGITVEPWQKSGQPYHNSAEMCLDVLYHMHLYVFVGGTDHALLGYTPDVNRLSVNVKFRAVHDLFGHAAEGCQFGPRGEENAWLVPTVRCIRPWPRKPSPPKPGARMPGLTSADIPTITPANGCHSSAGAAVCRAEGCTPA